MPDMPLAADRAALALEHAALLERERQARAAAEAARRRLEALARITDATLAYLPHDRLLDELLARICDSLGADTAAILLVDEARPVLRARAARGIAEQVERGVVVPLGAGFAGRVAAERRPIAIEDLAAADLVNPLLRERGIRSLLGVPLLVEGAVRGVLHVGSLTPRRFTPDERDLLQLAADRAALAIEHANLFEQRQLAAALQRHLLPQDLDAIPGLELATRYVPASRDRLGGDWYDAFEVAPGEIVVAVGDVVGHGLAAAAVMAQLRTALRAYAAEGHPEAEVVERVNRLMCELGPDATTTLAYTVIETQRRRLRVVTAGHPPPLVVDPAGAAAFLPLQGGVPLGASPLARYRSVVHPFPTGATLVLYTDGLVESRTEPLDRGLERLRAAAAGGGGLEALCTR
ncbi:MAG: SpoIIE family protein phosphatase, partial [Solirubrobacteraceae bacterium]|nr:SpoIIE family protein phosphatase [Solirubrobacteraceae bacterium]